MKAKVLIGIWAAASVLLGGMLMSYHQPFRAPDPQVFRLVAAGSTTRTTPAWHAIHVLSGSCQCSQQVMQHLLDRRPFAGIDEQVLLVDAGAAGGPGAGMSAAYAYLPGSSSLIAGLGAAGFTVTHLAEQDIPPSLGLPGVPVLVLVSSDNRVVYMGGYGPRRDEDVTLLKQLAGASARNAPSAALLRQVAKPQPILGCAIGAAMRHRLDPFHLQYLR